MEELDFWSAHTSTCWCSYLSPALGPQSRLSWSVDLIVCPFLVFHTRVTSSPPSPTLSTTYLPTSSLPAPYLPAHDFYPWQFQLCVSPSLSVAMCMCVVGSRAVDTSFFGITRDGAKHDEAQRGAGWRFIQV
jgi:hypothetical protein